LGELAHDGAVGGATGRPSRSALVILARRNVRRLRWRLRCAGCLRAANPDVLGSRVPVVMHRCCDGRSLRCQCCDVICWWGRRDGVRPEIRRPNGDTEGPATRPKAAENRGQPGFRSIYVSWPMSLTASCMSICCATTESSCG